LGVYLLIESHVSPFADASYVMPDFVTLETQKVKVPGLLERLE